jgi:hypothetical protein
MLFKEIIAVNFENHTKPINVLSGQSAELLAAEAGNWLSLCFKGLTKLSVTQIYNID